MKKKPEAKKSCDTVPWTQRTYVMFLFLSRLFWLPVSPEECIEVSPSEPEPESELASGGCTLGTCNRGKFRKMEWFYADSEFQVKKGGKETTKLTARNAELQTGTNLENFCDFMLTEKFKLKREDIKQQSQPQKRPVFYLLFFRKVFTVFLHTSTTENRTFLKESNGLLALFVRKTFLRLAKNL